MSGDHRIAFWNNFHHILMENNQVDAAPIKQNNEDKSLLFDVIGLNGMCKTFNHYHFRSTDVDSSHQDWIWLIYR